MAKQPKWTNKELEYLKVLLDKHTPYNKISKILNRTENGIKIASYRLLGYKPICLDCNKRIEKRKGNRLRCSSCSVGHTKICKKKYAKEWQDYFREIKNENRFGGNRRLVLERDLYKCQICRKSHHQILLDVHHIDKSGRNKKIHNHSLNNLITLCHPCHTKQHKEDTILKRWAKA